MPKRLQYGCFAAIFPSIAGGICDMPPGALKKRIKFSRLFKPVGKPWEFISSKTCVSVKPAFWIFRICRWSNLGAHREVTCQQSAWKILGNPEHVFFGHIQQLEIQKKFMGRSADDISLLHQSQEIDPLYLARAADQKVPLVIIFSVIPHVSRSAVLLNNLR